MYFGFLVIIVNLHNQLYLLLYSNFPMTSLFLNYADANEANYLSHLIIVAKT